MTAPFIATPATVPFRVCDDGCIPLSQYGAFESIGQFMRHYFAKAAHCDRSPTLLHDRFIGDGLCVLDEDIDWEPTWQQDFVKNGWSYRDGIVYF